MAKAGWKEGRVINIETRKDSGVYVLAQMVTEPYLVIYKSFSKEENPSGIDLQNTPVLFCYGVTRQFLKNSKITVTDIKPAVHNDLPRRWIKINPEARKVVVWKGSPGEKSFILMGEGGSLVEKDIRATGFQPENVIMRSISANDEKTINQHELTSLGIHAEFNERLYLCYLLDKNADPYKDLVFDRPLPLEYKHYVEIISS